MQRKRNKIEQNKGAKNEQSRSYKVLGQRALVIGAGLVIIYFANYSLEITQQRIEVLRRGKNVEGIVSKISTRRSSKMLYVMISNKEYDLGYVSGADTKAELDDPIRVLYLPDIPYAVPESRKSYQSTIVFEYLAFVFGAVLILIGIFYPREKIMKVKN